MKSRNSIKPGDIDISQRIIRPKIRAYLTAMNSPPEMIAAFKRGYCSGLSTLAIYGLYLESLDQSGAVSDLCDNWVWLKKILKKLSRWDENINTLRKKDRANIERLIAHLEFIQHISTYLAVGQGDIHHILEDTQNRKPLLEYTLAGLFSADDFTKAINIDMNGAIITTSLIEQLLRHDRRMILISCGKHTLGLFKNGAQISLYNSNHKAGMQSFDTSQHSALINAIFRAYKSSCKLPAPFGFRIFAFAETPAAYPEQIRLLAAVDCPDSSPCAQSTRIHSAMHIAARIGSMESMRYYLSRNAKIDSLSRARRTPLYVAASKGHLAVAKLLLSLGADMNKVCRHNKTPLIRAAEKGHLDILEYMLENNNDSMFQNLITALTHLANVPLRQQLLRMLQPEKVARLFHDAHDLTEKLLQYPPKTQIYSPGNRLLFFSHPGSGHTPARPRPAVNKTQP